MNPTLETINKALADIASKQVASVGATDATLASLTKRLEAIEVARDRGTYIGDPRPSVMDAITKSDGYARAKSGVPSGRIELPGLTVKALTSTQAGGSPNVGFDVQPQRWAGIASEDPRRRLLLQQALPSIPVVSNSFEWHELSGYINAAAVQASEGVTKAEATVPLSLRSAQIATIAHYVVASRQVLDDVPGLSNYIQSLLLYGLAAKVEAAFLAGASPISGLLSESQLAVTTATKAADQISEAMAQLDATGYNANLVVMHPTDWHKVRSERATGGNEQYVAGGWASPDAPVIWGLPVVTSSAITQGVALVLDTSGVLVLDRSQASIMIGTDSGQFTANLLTILAELRVGLATLSNGAVSRVQLTF